MSPRTISKVSYNFADDVVLVTGASHGLGRAHTRAFAAAGADLVICDIGKQASSVPYDLATADELEATAEEVRAMGVRCLPVVCDVSDGAQVQSMVAQAIAEFGKIDILVANAGVASFPFVKDMTEEQWDRVINTNLKGTFLCCKYVAAGMMERRSGKIITTGGMSAILGRPGEAHYSASKHGIVGFSRSLAIELAPYQINVNIVLPGAHATDMVANIGKSSSPEVEVLKGLATLGGAYNLFDPDDSMLEPEEVTRAAMWLASDASDYVTGALLVVDAGCSIK
jgi:NAD(P)-dependent dehydrogenase (short-subunit alcohol dehydrogenase family)